jgi:hypothetical protein
MALNAAAKIEYGWIDNSNERTRTQLHVGYDIALGAAEIAITGNALRILLEAITDCNETRVSAVIPVHSAVPSLPASAWANRESGIRLFYADNVTGKVYHADLPGVNQSLYRVPGTDVPTPTLGLQALYDGITAMVWSEMGNPCTFVRAVLYGKNL